VKPPMNHLFGYHTKDLKVGALQPQCQTRQQDQLKGCLPLWVRSRLIKCQGDKQKITSNS